MPQAPPLLRREAPAKINLSLHILGPRDDGFTEIDSTALPLRLADEIEFRPGHGTLQLIVRGAGREVPTDSRNLAWRAAEAFFAAIGQPPDIHLTLFKVIPTGAGLGGGSSDAAQVLLGLNQLHNHPLTSETLHELAAQLGSDVPFFLLQAPARLQGRGEILSPLPPPPAWPILLLKPSFGIPTAWAYRAWQTNPEARALTLLHTWKKIPRELRECPLGNDLIGPVYHKFLLLPILQQWLATNPGVLFAQMSGSGSTIFAVLRSADLARPIIEGAAEEFGPLWSCATQPRAQREPTRFRATYPLPNQRRFLFVSHPMPNQNATDLFAGRTSVEQVEEGQELAPKFDEQGLIPVVTTDFTSGELLMHAYMNREALTRTIQTGEAHYWSRSRACLWHKGATSGFVQIVREIRIDDDQDCVWLRVETAGGANCHVGYRSCFYRTVPVGSQAGDRLGFVETEKVFDPQAVYGDAPNPTRL
jgi:phosphoribosyl-AMP cyclohydrolase